MTSWVYVFSKFTPEALLFEALLISILVAGYAAFWVLHKRKYGSADSVVPTGVVKGYLNELIGDAQRLRAQLFGLLGGNMGEIPATMPAQNAAFQGEIPTISVDSTLAKNLAMLEAKLAEQGASMEAVLAQKARLEEELASAREQKPEAGSSAPSVDAGALTELQGKIKNLESKLAEYSVIEDDLANLKRLQQENATLKAQIAKGGVPAPEPAPEPVVPQITKAGIEAALPEAGSIDQNSIDALFASPAPAAAEAAAPAEAAPAAADPAADALFEGLVDQVEKSLLPDEPAAAAADPAAAQEASTSAASAPKIEKSDADLVAEFEKMLSG